jgi:tetratricopeptide (TPR) repeat protein
VLFNSALYDYAAEEYTQALKRGLLTAEVYFHRGRAYLEAGEYELAMDDFDQAEVLDSSLMDLYLERGLLYYQLWQQDNTPEYAEAARADLEEYGRLGGDMTLPRVTDALAGLDAA